MKKEGATQTNEKHNKLIFLREEISKINKQKINIEKNMIKKEQTYKNFVQNKKDILTELKNMNEFEDINNLSLESMTNNEIMSILNKVIMKREELISLSGQVVNGMLSADGSIISKVIDRTLHKQIAESAVDVARDMLTKIDSMDLKD